MLIFMLIFVVFHMKFYALIVMSLNVLNPAMYDDYLLYVNIKYVHGMRKLCF